MAKTYLPNGAGAPFKNIIRFIGGKPLDGRTVVDTYSDISGDNYKALFTNEDNGSQIISYYTGMLVVTKDTGKLYVLASDGLFKEVTPDLSNIYGSITAENYTAAKALAGSNNIGQIIYVTEEETSTTEKDEEGNFIVYSAGPYVVTGEGTIAKLGTTSASGDLAGDVETLKGNVGTINTAIEDIKNNDLPIILNISSIKNSVVEAVMQRASLSAEQFKTLTGIDYVEFKNSDNLLRLILTDGNTQVQFDSVSNDKKKLCGQFSHYTDDGYLHYAAVIEFVSDSILIITGGNYEQHYGLATGAQLEALSETVSQLPLFSTEVYNATEDAPFPAEPNNHTLYLIPEEGSEGDVYREWIYVNNTWEKLGVHSLDVNAISEALNDKVNVEEGKELISSTLIPVITENKTAIGNLTAVVGEEDLAASDLYGGSAPSSLVVAANTLAEEIVSLKENAVLTVTSANEDYLTVSESNNTATLTPVICAIEDATSELTGLADAYDVQQYIQKALEWNEV